MQKIPTLGLVLATTALSALPLHADVHVLAADDAAISLTPLGQYRSGLYDESGAEIVAYDAASRRAFVVNAAGRAVDVLDMGDPTAPGLLFSIDVTDIGADANSVAVHGGIVAVAVQAADKTQPGFVVFHDTDGNRIAQVQAGALPDALTFSPDGSIVVVVNEGEPADDYAIDPEGSITIIDLSGGVAGITQANVRHADFRAFNGREDALRSSGVRIFGPGASAAQDFEPEWAEVARDNRTAYVGLQENNAIAVVDLVTAEVTAVHPLGFKDWATGAPWSGAGFDGSRRGDVALRNWPVLGMFLPDTIRIHETGGETFIVTANEGDARAYDEEGWWLEEMNIRSLRLDPAAFPDAEALQAREAIGDLLVTTTLGVANDCDPSSTTAQVQSLGFATIEDYVSSECVYDALYTYGGRSASIFRVTDVGLELVWDSGSQMEETVLALLPDFFNADNRHRDEQRKRRSINKGPEPEGVALGTVDGRSYAFVGLERIGGVMVYDITVPAETRFVKYINTRDFAFAVNPEGATATDLGAEGLHFVPAAESPDASGRPLLLIGNETSGTTRVFAIDTVTR